MKKFKEGERLAFGQIIPDKTKKGKCVVVNPYMMVVDGNGNTSIFQKIGDDLFVYEGTTINPEQAKSISSDEVGIRP